MARAVALRGVGARDPLVRRMVGVSAAVHAVVLALALVVLPALKPMPLPIVAYTVELTDPAALGGRLPPGPLDKPVGPRPGPVASADATTRLGAPDAAPTPPATPPTEAVAETPPPPPKPPVPRAEPKQPEPKQPEPPKPEAVKPLVKPEPPKPPPPKPVAARPEPPKPDPPRAEPAKPEVKKPEPAKPGVDKPTDSDAAVSKAAKPTQPPSGQATGKADGKSSDAGSAPDAYAALGDKWRAKAATGGGGGVGGRDPESGPIGAGAYGAGGGGQVVGLEFLAYQQRVVSTVKDIWVNAVSRPGLVAKVRFRIAPTGAVSEVRLEQASGDPTFDGSVVRAVQRANPLPAPPARYAAEFQDFVIEFHSEEGGQGAG